MAEKIIMKTKEDIENEISEMKRQRNQFWTLMSEEDKRKDELRILDLEKKLNG